MSGQPVPAGQVRRGDLLVHDGRELLVTGTSGAWYYENSQPVAGLAIECWAGSALSHIMTCGDSNRYKSDSGPAISREKSARCRDARCASPPELKDPDGGEEPGGLTGKPRGWRRAAPAPPSR